MRDIIVISALSYLLGLMTAICVMKFNFNEMNRENPPAQIDTVFMRNTVFAKYEFSEIHFGLNLKKTSDTLKIVLIKVEK